MAEQITQSAYVFALKTMQNVEDRGERISKFGGGKLSPNRCKCAYLFEEYGTTPGNLHPQECLPRCTYRCSKTQYKKPCMFFCQKCCAKCLCVPPGTYGNKQFCPCYNNWKTKRGGPKCP
uniref:Protein GAST1-like n=1 Tax=Nicotiana tabacum TaxID=4097 RepID=A0A1S4BG87_TOBAC|nr:PREDICTED: protein GAST1-like [Nicotiana tabacum]